MKSKGMKYEPLQVSDNGGQLYTLKRHVPSARFRRRCFTFIAITILLLILAAVFHVTYMCPHHKFILIDIEPEIPTLPLVGDVPQSDGQQESLEQTDSLTDSLEAVIFKNYGIVRNTDKFAWKEIPCGYLESQNVSGPYVSWADTQSCNYLFKQIGSDLVDPPSGMRSSVPLGGISTGVFELRGDGSFHEWTIFNQHPAGAAKIQLLDDMFMGLRTEVSGGESMAVVLQTHPNNKDLPAVQALEYRGSHPVTKLTVQDSRVPIEASVYAYAWYKHNDMNVTATPAVAFTAVLHNPLNEEVATSFMINMPLGIEAHTQRYDSQMPKFVPINNSTSDDYDPYNILSYGDIKNNLTHSVSHVVEGVSDEMDCFTACDMSNTCQSWSFDVATGVCTQFMDVRMNGHKDGSFAGVKSFWSRDKTCVTNNRDTPGFSTNGNMSLCAFSDDDVSTSFGIDNDVNSLWKDFSQTGEFSNSPSGGYVSGAAASQVILKPGETREVTIVLGWYFPDRDFLGIPVGNYYSHLVKNSSHAASLLGNNLQAAVTNVTRLHSTFFDSSVPDTLQDLLINSLSHIRSAFWLKDGRWRQWEAYDCVNMDSVHNDGERHIPYIMVFPDSLINKMYAWAGFQLDNGMIQEQLRCGCQDLPIYPITVEFGCGRTMSDVSSMFIVYLLEILQWHPDTSTNDIVKELWPNAKRAAEWHLNISAADGMPKHLVTTYDVLATVYYPYVFYNGAFHLLAMKAAEKLATWIGDTEFAIRCNDAFVRGQTVLDAILWNETAQYYNAYTTEKEFDYKLFYENRKKNICGHRVGDAVYDKDGKEICVETPDPNPNGAIMTDTFYAQVLAYSLGFGTLVKDEDKLRKHMKAELAHNDSPYGMLVLTGRYPYPGPPQDNAVWLMGNPNWATINLHLGGDPEMALEVGMKSLNQFRSVLHENWNVAGIMGGLGYNLDGLPYATSHYGYYMSAWHIVLALSGQNADLNAKKLTFSPKLKPPFKLPVMLPTVWGSLQSDLAPVNGSTSNQLEVVYTLSLEFGQLEIADLSVGGCKYKLNTDAIHLGVGAPIKWQCPYMYS